MVVMMMVMHILISGWSSQKKSYIRETGQDSYRAAGNSRNI